MKCDRNCADMSLLYFFVAELFEKSGDKDTAEVLHKYASDINEPMNNITPPFPHKSIIKIADDYLSKNQYEKAAFLYIRAMAIMKDHDYHPSYLIYSYERPNYFYDNEDLLSYEFNEALKKLMESYEKSGKKFNSKDFFGFDIEEIEPGQKKNILRYLKSPVLYGQLMKK